ncbi:hypothetical protein RP75_06170 [Agrobacterium arsenijevicii]|uniref:Uncharacterized protein n=1 Tax=Agrobacterium arsenijevicii TaxID=1585697 RepID=A0ABR5DC67_9HYPH|nr:hypothetical protein RP75_06170 [Agrobacterium arsenijevicii]
MLQSEFGTTAFVRECDALRSTAGEALDDDAAGGDAHDFGVAQASFAGGGSGIAFAAAAHAGWASAVHLSITVDVSVADDRANAVSAYPQLHVLRACRDRCGNGHQRDAKCQTGGFY